MGRGDLAGAAHLELLSGVVPLRPEDAMIKAMLNGWRAQQKARGLQDSTITPRERLVLAFVEFTNEYPWNWGPGHVEEWALSLAARYVSSQMRHRFLLFPKLPPGADAA